MKTITGTENAIDCIIKQFDGAQFLLKKNKFGFIDVVNESGEIIGSASLYASGHGYAIRTRNYGGFAGHNEVRFIN